MTGDVTIMRFPMLGRKRLMAATVLALLVVASGCSTTLNTGTLQSQLAEQIAARIGVPADAVTVVCPTGIAAEAGARSVCSAKVEGFTYEVTVVQTNSEGAVQWDLSEPTEDASTTTSTTAGS